MKMNKKTKMVILASTLVLSIICVVFATNLTYNADNKESSVKIAKVASSSDYNTVTLEKCYVTKIDREFNYIELQTWDFDYITINFLEDSIDSFDYDLGDNITLSNVKRKCINDTFFYFADNDTEITLNTFNTKSTNKVTVPQNNIVDDLQENEDYNYNRDTN